MTAHRGSACSVLATPAGACLRGRPTRALLRPSTLVSMPGRSVCRPIGGPHAAAQISVAARPPVRAAWPDTSAGPGHTEIRVSRRTAPRAASREPRRASTKGPRSVATPVRIRAVPSAPYAAVLPVLHTARRMRAGVSPAVESERRAASLRPHAPSERACRGRALRERAHITPTAGPSSSASPAPASCVIVTATATATTSARPTIHWLTQVPRSAATGVTTTATG